MASTPPNKLDAECASFITQEENRKKERSLQRQGANSKGQELADIARGPSACSILQAIHRFDAAMRLITVALQVKNNGVGEDDIDRYLASCAEYLKDPFTGRPFVWDKDGNTLSFPTGADHIWPSGIKITL
ncbi:MAG: hypothetical protein ACI9BW_004066 [Gammaproteobacteria bacterium]|jgi:hypothetical protein